MSSGRKRLDNPAQLNLFELLIQDRKTRSETPREGSLNIHDLLHEACLHALQQALPTSRWEIAGRISNLLGVEVTKYQIDAWIAESKNGHRIPAAYIPAFCVATSCNEPLRVLAEAAGVFTLPGPDALRSEIRKIEEQTEALHRKKKKHLLFLQEMEGKRS